MRPERWPYLFFVGLDSYLLECSWETPTRHSRGDKALHFPSPTTHPFQPQIIPTSIPSDFPPRHNKLKISDSKHASQDRHIFKRKKRKRKKGKATCTHRLRSTFLSRHIHVLGSASCRPTHEPPSKIGPNKIGPSISI